MSWRSGRFAFALALMALACSEAHAQLWQTADTPRPKQVTVGAYAQVAFSPGAFQGYAQGLYGLNPRTQAEVRVGAGTEPLYAGVFLKRLLVSTHQISISLWGGPRVQNQFLIDSALILSRSFESWEAYCAPWVTIGFGGSGGVGLGFVPGFSIFATSRSKLFAEGLLGTSRIHGSFSMGLRYYL